ncbi:MAG: hypothetical protein KDH98_14460, partial [Calditrichaeota bacterium]|nr:hypothetical protein [Calditrichota bacterium]
MNSSNKKIPENSKHFCNFCKRVTNHIKKCTHASENWVDVENEYEVWEERNYVLWYCAGCENGTMEILYTNDAYLLDENGNHDYELEYFPKRNYDDLEIKHFIKLPNKLSSLYKETINSYNESLDILCAAVNLPQFCGHTKELYINNQNYRG